MLALAFAGRSWTVVRANGVPVVPVDRFLAYLECLPRSPNTVVADATMLRAKSRHRSLRSLERYTNPSDREYGPARRRQPP